MREKQRFGGRKRVKLWGKQTFEHWGLVILGNFERDYDHAYFVICLIISN